MSREWVDDHKPRPRRGPDTRDRRWVMRCDCWHSDHSGDAAGPLLRCRVEGEPSITEPPLEQYADAGWFIAEVHGDRCPSCLAVGHAPTDAPHISMTRKAQA